MNKSKTVIFHQLMQINCQCNKLLDWCLTPYRVTYWQWRILKSIHRKRLAPEMLCEHLHMNRSELNKLLEALEIEQLIRNESNNAITYTHFIAITPAGEAIYKKAKSLMQHIADKVFCRNGDVEVEVFSNMLDDIATELTFGFQQGKEINDLIEKE